ncbi:sensor histidine kinase [Laceyella putida]|uniref:histidine kinase n=1 Tax=Laceyella putida TaxID=110101 RepID=A0ABW2RJZ4_9BACL
MFRKVLTGHLFVLGLAILLSSVLLSVMLENLLIKQKAREMREWAQPLAKQLKQEKQIPLAFLRRLEPLLERSRVDLLVFDKEGKPLYPSGSTVAKPLRLPSAMQARVAGGGRLEGTGKWGGKQVTWALVPIGGKQREGWVFLYSPVEGLRKVMAHVRVSLMVAGSLALVASFAVSIGMTRHLVRRLQGLQEGTKRIQAGEYSFRLSVAKVDDEIDALAVDFNEMAMRLEQTQQELRLHEERRQQFLFDLSHELRTPLTSLRGWLEALGQGWVENAQLPSTYARMEKETKRLIRLIHELMDIEKIQAGKVELVKERADLTELIDLVVEQLMPLADAKGLTLQAECAGAIPIYADLDRILQVLLNLTKNAIQFTDRGEVVVRAYATSSETVIQVADTGIGMTEEESRRIWDRFFKADPARMKQESETGLGLAIVKQLVEAHEGDIQVESQPGKGTCFTLSLPLPSFGQKDV